MTRFLVVYLDEGGNFCNTTVMALSLADALDRFIRSDEGIKAEILFSITMAH